MPKFRKKPVVIEAIQLTEYNVQKCYDFVGAKGNFPECGMGIDPEDGQFKIITLNGVVIVDITDWIIKGVAGEFYPCKSNIFEKTYDFVEDWEKRKSNSPEEKLLTAVDLMEKTRNLDNRDLVAAVIEHDSLLEKPVDSWERALIEELMNRVYPGWYNIFYPEKKET